MNSSEEFWAWFIRNETQLFTLDKAQELERERVYDEVVSHLRRVNPNLTFEFEMKGTKKEFVISAGGLKELFPVVVSLVRDAPCLERWEVTAFRPRRSSINVVEFRSKRIDPAQVSFSLLSDGKNAGINLFIPGYSNDDTDLKQIAYLLLDDALGEYDVETKLGLIKILPPEASTPGNRYPIAQLASMFDKLVRRLEGHKEPS